jgi:hypothetical protein
LNDACSAIAGRSTEDHAALTSIFMLSGRMARVKSDGPSGASLLTHNDTLPADLKPMLVLDASGRVRKTYQDIADYRGDLIRLPSGEKDYSPLTVHVWQTAGSKTGWQRRGPELVEGIIQAITTKAQSKPNDRWLIVHHKVSNRVLDVQAEVTKRLPSWMTQGDEKAPVQFVHWGRHMATNVFADVANVVLAGTLFMRPSFYAALTYHSQNKDAAQVKLPDAEVQATTIGEHMDLLLQAICRGRVRKLDGEKCCPMDAYVIASPLSGIPGALKTVFPGCRRERWNPLNKPVTGKLAQAVDVLEALAGVGLSPISYRDIRGYIALKDVNQFRRDVMVRGEWLDALAGHGYIQTTLKGGGKGIVLLPEASLLDMDCGE